MKQASQSVDSISQHGRVIQRKRTVSGDDAHAFMNRLCDEQPVKGIAMMVRQTRQLVDLSKRDWEKGKCSVSDLGVNYTGYALV